MQTKTAVTSFCNLVLWDHHGICDPLMTKDVMCRVTVLREAAACEQIVSPSPNSHLEILTPRTSACDLLRDGVSTQVIELE
jgi:hypothetical protein